MREYYKSFIYLYKRCCFWIDDLCSVVKIHSQYKMKSNEKQRRFV